MRLVGCALPTRCSRRTPPCRPATMRSGSILWIVSSASYWGQMGLDRERFLALGQHDYSWGPQFSMTVLALRTAGLANGVSELHGEVSRRMWQALWPGLPEAEAPIGYVTNGVHTDTWIHPGLAALLDRYLGSELARCHRRAVDMGRRRRHSR